MQIEWGKLGVLLTIVICATGLAAVHIIEPAMWFGIVTGVGGYVYGNGRLAIRGGDHVGAFTPREQVVAQALAKVVKTEADHQAATVVAAAVPAKRPARKRAPAKNR